MQVELSEPLGRYPPLHTALHTEPERLSFLQLNVPLGGLMGFPRHTERKRRTSRQARRHKTATQVWLGVCVLGSCHIQTAVRFLQ